MAIRSTDPSDIETVTADYTARAAVHASDADSAVAKLRAVGAGRLVCFVAMLAEAGGVIAGRVPSVPGWSLFAATTSVFVVLVAWHRRVYDRERIHRALERACRTGIDRVHRRWTALPDARPINFAADHAFAGDLHITGQQSLAKLLPAISPAAGIVMSEWLLAEEPPHAEALRSRQTTVRAFAAQHDWRERLSVHAARLNGNAASLETFFAWAESDSWLEHRAVLRWTVRALTAVTLPALIVAVAHLIPVGVVLVLVVVNFLVTSIARNELAETLTAASSSGARLRGYGTLFRHAQSALANSPSLRALDERIGGSVSGGAFDTLDQLAACGEVRLSTMGHYAMQALLLWDFHVVDALEFWQRRHGRAVRGWIRALGEVESQAAFATIAYENPRWVFPTFHDDAPGTLDASMLAHPLLPADVRMGNSVSLGPRGDILLVTGSNMAGKTTLLRAIALNIVLAQAGAPVCADALELSRFRLRTSMHASDSLERGLSLFMAELVRLKSIVDAANAASDCALLYLADEILRGTNAVDRHSAIVTVLGTLTNAGAVGVVATHDPDLAHATTLESRMHAVNLIEQFRDGPNGPVMWFDYRLRPGVATTRNAIKLLEMVGLGVAPPNV